MQTQKSKIDTGKAAEADLVITESNGIESEEQDNSSRSRNDTNANDAGIRPIYDEEPVAKVQLTAEFKSHMLDSSPDNQTTDYSKQSLEFRKVIATAALKNELRKLKGNSVDTKFAKTSVLGKPVLQPLRNQSVVRKPNALDLKDLKFQNHEVNSRANIQSNKTRNSNKPVEQKSHTQKLVRQIFTEHRFSPNKTFGVYEKTFPRHDLRWKPTGRFFKTVGLRWILMGKILASCTSKDDNEPTRGSNVNIPNFHESKQSLDLSAGTSINVQKEQSFNLSSVVSKSSVVTTDDTSDKRQQQPESTPSTLTLATTVTADGNSDFDNGNPSKVNIKQLCDRYSESNASALEDLTLCAGNPVKGVLIMNLLDHRIRRWCCSLIPAKSDS
ncbi:hypothetical protein Tco_0383173 [Tanacetum coccineum]